MSNRLMSRRNIAAICLFLEYDRADLLCRLRALPLATRARVMTALTLETFRS